VRNSSNTGIQISLLTNKLAIVKCQFYSLEGKSTDTLYSSSLKTFIKSQTHRYS